MQPNQSTEFGTLRSIFWPVYRQQVKLIIPMMLMLFFTCFNYSILRTLKDVVVVTAASSGGEVIPFIKVWAMLPMAVLSAFIFTRLVSRFSQEKVYYIMVSGFLIFFALFGFVIYPLSDSLQMNSFANFLETLLPAGSRGLIAMLRNWSLTLFYVMCELWGSMVMTVLFWGFANEITKVQDARRFYSLFAVVSNSSTIIAGLSGRYFSKVSYNPYLPFGNDAWEQTIMMVISFVILAGVGVMVTFWWLNKKVLNKPQYADLHANRKAPAIKKKQSMRESFRYLLSSKYLIYIAVIVVSYNLVINIVEVVWKDQLKELYPNKDDYFSYLSSVMVVLGIFSASTAFFVGKIISRVGWTKTALITPTLMLVTSVGFFGFMFICRLSGDASMHILGFTPLAIAVFFGSMQNCLSKTAKYSVFDATKEMAFIPLDHDAKLKGKAAIDGVGSRVGKSGGSFIHQGMLMVFASLSASAPYVCLILFGVIFVWISSAKLLGVEFSMKARDTSDIPDGVADAPAATLVKAEA